jgi:hypothetical protein
MQRRVTSATENPPTVLAVSQSKRNLAATTAARDSVANKDKITRCVFNVQPSLITFWKWTYALGPRPSHSLPLLAGTSPLPPSACPGQVENP